VLVLRWFLDATRVAQLAADNQVSGSTAYRYLHEAIEVLAGAAPSLHGALLADRMAGHTHVHPDGTLIRTDRSRAIGRTSGWTCGGRASTITTAGTSRSSPRPTGGRCGPPTCGPAVNTTPRLRSTLRRGAGLVGSPFPEISR
jgi:hypothetical protein